MYAGDALGDPLQAGRPVVDGVHAGDDRGQHLRRADVRGRALAPDVLLARLQREAIRRRALRVDADADEAAGQAALVLVAAGEVGGVRAAAAHRHAEALRRAAGDVGAELARRRDQGQREQVGGDDEGGAVGVDARRVAAQVVQRAAGRRPLGEDREVVAALDQRDPIRRPSWRGRPRGRAASRACAAPRSSADGRRRRRRWCRSSP